MNSILLGWLPSIERMAGEQTAICYSGGTVEVRLGDQVELRVWFRRRKGRVVYLPGVSPFNAHYEFDGMCWVAIRSKNMLIGTVVNHSTGMLKPKVKFMGRDESPVEALPDAEELEKGGGGWSP